VTYTNIGLDNLLICPLCGKGGFKDLEIHIRRKHLWTKERIKQFKLEHLEVRFTSENFHKQISEATKLMNVKQKEKNPEKYHTDKEKAGREANKLLLTWKRENPERDSQCCSKGGKRTHELHPTLHSETYIAQGKNRGPTSAEKKFIRLIHNYNLSFKYNSKGPVIIGGKIPDFVSTNDQRIVIEVNGDHWHGEKHTGKCKEKEENDRIEHFKKHDWHCIIFWESELDKLSDEEILERLRLEGAKVPHFMNLSDFY